MNNYIKDKIYGIPVRKREVNWCTSKSKRKDKEYIYKRNINGYIRWMVAFKRSNKYKCRYFKTMKEAKFYREFVKTFKAF